MNNFKKVPNEILLILFTYLDKESMLIAKDVCQRWRIMIHDLCWKHISRLAEGDRSIKKDFAMLGWLKDEHEHTHCRCINLHLGYYPFKNGTWTLTRHETTFTNVKADEESFAFEDSKVICARTFKAGNLTLHELDLKATSPSWKLVNDLKYDEAHLDCERVSIYMECCEKTLVLHEIFHELNEDRTEDKISLWNTETWAFVCYLPVQETMNEILKSKYGDSDKYIIEIVLLVSSDILVVWVYLNDNNVRDMNGLTLFWNFDASNPDSRAPSFLTYILQLTDGFCDYNYCDLHLNAKYFCKEEKDQLKVFALEDIRNNATNKFWIVPLESFSKSIWLESGCSRRFAVINHEGKDRELKLFNIESGECYFFLKLNAIFAQLTHSEWNLNDFPGPQIKFHLGKLIFLLPLRKQDDPSKYRYQLGIIDETAKQQVVKGAALDYEDFTEEDFLFPFSFFIGSGSIMKKSPNYISCWKLENLMQ